MTADAPVRTTNSHRELQRIEAFSDGVFAIACTLLVLEFKVPHVDTTAGSGALWPALRAVWPSLVAYVLSFFAILVAWAAHHRAFNILVASSKALMYANGFLMLTITFMPFPTAVLAEYINGPQVNIAVMFYSTTWLAVNVGFNVWWHSMLWPTRLVSPSVSAAAVKRVTLQIFSGLPTYAMTTIAAYWFPIAALIVILTSQVLWVISSVEDENAF